MLAPLVYLMTLQSAPPVPLPPEPQLSAALDLWQVRPLAPEARQDAVRHALSEYAYAALYEAKVKPSRQAAYINPLVVRLEASLPDAARIDADAMLCQVDAIARMLSVEDIAATKAFVSTPAGGRFWDVVVLYQTTLRGCYKTAVMWPVLRVMAAELARLGLKRPQPKRLKGDIVY